MRDRLRLIVGRDLRVEATRGRSLRWSGAAEFTGADDLARAIAELAAHPELAGIRRIGVALEAPVVQVRRLDGLPAARRSVLARMVAMQAGRYFRRNGKPLVTDAEPLAGRAWWRREKVPAPGVRAAAVEEPWLTAILAGAAAAGLEVDRIAPAAAPRLRLMPMAVRAAHRAADLRYTRRILTAAAVLWLGAGGVYVARLAGEARRIERALDQLREPVAAVMQVRAKLDRITATLTGLDDDAAGRGAMTTRLAALAGALPDSAYLTSVELGDSGGVVTGASTRAAVVVPALAASPLLSDARLDGPVVQDETGGIRRERFTIRFGRTSP